MTVLYYFDKFIWAVNYIGITLLVICMVYFFATCEMVPDDEESGPDETEDATFFETFTDTDTSTKVD